jgi:alcohol dehydrogenase (cytochrome c)
MNLFRYFAAPAFLLASLLAGQGLNPATLLKPTPDTWPTFNGDYSGRRYSSIPQINSANVHSLALAWTARANTGDGSDPTIKATPLVVNGIMYFTVPDHAWAIDARTGRQLWHYKWESKGGIHIGNRGVGMWGNWVYFETPDNHLVSLDALTGKFRWGVEIADLAQEYFSTAAPVVIGNHVIVGVGGDSLDVPGYLQARDPETGAVQWQWNTEPKPGEPGSETWPGKDAMQHGGGMTWIPGSYDPELNLIYWGTGNPNPVHAGQGRKGDNLWTCSIVALNPDTGKLVWYYQVSPHDTHDYDAVQTPVIFDAEIDGQRRKLVAQASRNGFFFVLDRTNGKHILTVPYGNADWAKGLDAQGRPIPDPDKNPKTDGSLAAPSAAGATNWYAPSYSPETGLFYVNTTYSYSVYYLTDTDPKPEGYGGRDAGVWSQHLLKALDPRTGKVAWEHPYYGFGNSSSGMLTTAGKLLFTGDPWGHFIAFDPANGHILWHAGVGSSVSNGPITYELDNRQYVVAAAGDTLYAFTLPMPTS